MITAVYKKGYGSEGCYTKSRISMFLGGKITEREFIYFNVIALFFKELKINAATVSDLTGQLTPFDYDLRSTPSNTAFLLNPKSHKGQRKGRPCWCTKQ